MAVTADPYEAVILLLFAAALSFGLYNLRDAWRNELAAIDSGVPAVGTLGLEDLGRAALAVAMGGIPGVVLALVSFTIGSPIQDGTPATPQELVWAIVLRVVLILFGAGLLMSAGLSYWARRRMARRREQTEPGVEEPPAPPGAAEPPPLEEDVAPPMPTPDPRFTPVGGTG